MTNEEIERRLVALEAAVAALRRQLAPKAPVGNWVERISGTFKDDPDFEEFVRLGREFREADRPLDEAEEQP